METKYNRANWIQYVTGIIVILALLLSFGAYTKDYPSATDIASQVKVTIPVSDPVSDQEITITEGPLTKEIYDKLFEEDLWKSDAEVLASEEWEERDYDDIADAINSLYPSNQIDDKEDIEYVREDENTTFVNMDADDKDGKVIQYVKVKYENDKGKDVKKYLTITSTFEDGELEEQEIDVTN